MGKKGLTREIIIDAAQAHIERHGLAAFSLRSLATHLGVRVSSLYNHIGGQSELLAQVGLRVVDMLEAAETTAIEGKHREEALRALADTYRGFARAHTELYRIIMGVHTISEPALETEAERVVKPILRVVHDYGIEGETAIHAQRMIRSAMHGFFAHENAGGFSLMPAEKDESYRLLIGCLHEWLTRNGRHES